VVGRRRSLVGGAGAREAEAHEERLAGLREELGQGSRECGEAVEEPDGEWGCWVEEQE
jgi:hypothetical protein